MALFRRSRRRLVVTGSQSKGAATLNFAEVTRR
jgi:hypothetical protein